MAQGPDPDEAGGVEAWLPDEHYMRQALDQAIAAWDAGEVPVGCVIVRSGRVIGAAHNQRETLRDPTAHAEMLAITQAAESMGDWRLEGCRIYVTLEPCCMCAGAIVLARLGTLVFGASDPKAGAVQSLYQVTSDVRLNHQPTVRGGILADACGDILSEFFRARRRAGHK